MMKKVWPVLLAVVLVFGFAVLGCGGGGGDEPGPGEDFEPFEFEGPWDDIVIGWGNNKPTITPTDAGSEISITASGSTGFIINFEDIGYDFNRSDTLIFTYKIEIETPKAVLTAKKVDGDNLGEFAGDSDWGQGKGREYVLGEDVLSNYEATGGKKVAGTWDGTTGTFEVLMKYLSAGATAIGFQHNFWCDMGTPNVKNAENSVYKLTITKIENKAGEAPPAPPPPTGTAFFDNAVGLTEGIGTYGNGTHEFEGGILTITGNGGFFVPLPAGFTVADTVSIQYACINVSTDLEEPVKFIKKQIGGWTDVADAEKYPTFITTEVSTITVTGFNAEGVGVGKAFFQTNGNAFKAMIKIISITKVAGDPIKITLPVPGLVPVGGLPPKATTSTEQYTAAVTWKDSSNAAVSGNFAVGGVYTATIVLTTTDPGYTFTGVAANAITVTGADTSSHPAATSATTLTVTATFPAAVAPPAKNVTFAAGDVKGRNATIALVETTGFSAQTTQGYDWAYAYFKVTFDTGFKLSNYSKMDYKVTGNVGNSADFEGGPETGYKGILIYAYASQADIEAITSTGIPADNQIAGGTGWEGPGFGNFDTPAENTVTITTGDVDANEVWIVIRTHAKAGIKFTVEDIKFYN